MRVLSAMECGVAAAGEWEGTQVKVRLLSDREDGLHRYLTMRVSRNEVPLTDVECKTFEHHGPHMAELLWWRIATPLVNI